MHGFNCADAADMHLALLAERTLHDRVLPFKKIAEYLKLPLEDVKKLQAGQGI